MLDGFSLPFAPIRVEQLTDKPGPASESEVTRADVPSRQADVHATRLGDAGIAGTPRGSRAPSGDDGKAPGLEVSGLRRDAAISEPVGSALLHPVSPTDADVAE